MKWVDSGISNNKKRTAIKCRANGKWKKSKAFRCINPCPPMTILKNKYVKVRYEWQSGFQMLIKLRPNFDLNDWTVVFYFENPPQVNVKFYSWETKLTISANGQIATMTSMPWNIGVKKGKIYKFLLVVTGGSRRWSACN